MLKLCVLTNNNLRNIWLPDGKEIPTVVARVIGPAIKDVNGVYERGEWLQFDGTNVTINQAVKDQILADEAARETQLANLRAERDNLINNLRQIHQDILAASTAAEIKAVLVKIVRLMGLIHAKF